VQNAQLLRELEQLRREKEDRERELEDENTELKGELAKLRAEMDAVLKELQTIVDSKLGLELEIAAYRKLLEGEETRYVTHCPGGPDHPGWPEIWLSPINRLTIHLLAILEFLIGQSSRSHATYRRPSLDGF